MSDEIRLDSCKMKALVVDIFTRLGLTKDNAETVADCLIAADLRGVSSHGVARLKSYIERAQNEHWNPNPNFSFSESFAVCQFNGDDGYGAVVGTEAMKKAIELASQFGVGMVAVSKSTHFGMAGYYSLLAAKKGMIGFSCTNGVSNLSVYGAMEGMLGTSPFAIAVPIEGQAPFTLDISCSVAARGKISAAKREKKAIPPEWALGFDGRPTTDPNEALAAGALLPFGGHKGSGIAMVIDILCGILNKGVTACHVRENPETGPNVGHFFMAINIADFVEPTYFSERMKQFTAELKEAKPIPNTAGIFIPGERAEERVRLNLKEGIPIEYGAYSEIAETCTKFGLKEELESCVVKSRIE